jgi:sensor histidine kinase regulating citrate/malate metabolism
VGVDNNRLTRSTYPAGMDVGFRRISWVKTRSAWQDMQYHRKRRAAAIKRHTAMMDAINAAFSAAQQNKISGMANNAAQAALKRVQALGQTKLDEMTKKIESAQSLVDQTQSSMPETSGSSTVLDTVV